MSKIGPKTEAILQNVYLSGSTLSEEDRKAIRSDKNLEPDQKEVIIKTFEDGHLYYREINDLRAKSLALHELLDGKFLKDRFDKLSARLEEIILGRMTPSQTSDFLDALTYAVQPFIYSGTAHTISTNKIAAQLSYLSQNGDEDNREKYVSLLKALAPDRVCINANRAISASGNNEYFMQFPYSSRRWNCATITVASSSMYHFSVQLPRDYKIKVTAEQEELEGAPSSPDDSWPTTWSYRYFNFGSRENTVFFIDIFSIDIFSGDKETERYADVAIRFSTHAMVH